MKLCRLFFLFITGVLAAILVACSIPPGSPSPTAPSTLPKEKPAKAEWETKWESALAAAKKEGVASIYAYVGTDTREALSTAFKNRYGINLEFTIASESEILQKISKEKEAKLNLVDVTILSPMSYILYLKPMGVLTPLDKHLILPEATDEKKWTGGKVPIFDQDRTILTPIYAYFSYILINRDLVKEGEITSYADLLKPNWRGKMVMFDPTAGPSPTQTFVNYVIPRMMGPEEGRKYLSALTKQDLVFIKDHRQLVEWVAKEKYPVAIGATPSIVVGFVRAGAPITFVRPKEGGLLAVGASLISIIKDGPHPNAADVFINWILTEEGQEVFAANQAYPPRRLGVPYKGPDPFPVLLPGDKTFESDEAFYIEGQKTLGWAQEIFGPVVK